MFYFQCGICWRHFLFARKIKFQTCVDKHKFCASCCCRYLNVKVDNGVTEINCPGWNCSALVAEKEVQNNLPTARFQKFKRFMSMANDSNYRECDTCEKVLHFKEGVKVCQCIHCKVSFCFDHGEIKRPTLQTDPNTNTDSLTCDLCTAPDETKSQARDFASFYTIKLISKKCPQCGVPIQKNGGCDSMVSNNENTLIQIYMSYHSSAFILQTCSQCEFKFPWNST
jgi:hypothetical protein